MICPVCNNEHTTRPRQCLQQATLDHVGQCGIGTAHQANCLLKQLNEYVDANPLWSSQAKPQGT